MKTSVTILSLLITVNCFCQQQEDPSDSLTDIVEIVKYIAKENVLMGRAISYDGHKPIQYKYFESLRKKASKEELTELTNHANGVVRGYAFWALAYHQSADLLPIIIHHLNDTLNIRMQFGCTVFSQSVGDFFIDVVTPQSIDLDCKKLNAQEFYYLDSLLLFTPTHLWTRQASIKRYKHNEKLYRLLRELYLKENDQDALVELAKYKRKKDIQLILNNEDKGEKFNKLSYTYDAIIQFPDAAFKHFLKKNFYKVFTYPQYYNEWKGLYESIASFKNQWAKHLLNVPFTHIKHEGIREYHMQFLFEAIQNYYSPLYNEHLWKLWENEHLINEKVFKLLCKEDPDRAFGLIKKTLENTEDYYYLGTSEYYKDDLHPNLINIMLDTLIQKDLTFALKAINKNIREVNVHEFWVFADKVAKLKDTSLISSLFARIEKEDNGIIYLKAIKVLLGLRDNRVDKRLTDLIKNNKVLSSGSNCEYIRQLLRENNIE